MAPKIAIVFESPVLNGRHIRKLAEAEKAGIEVAGGKADLYQVEETLPQAVRSTLGAPGQDKSISFISPTELEKYDASLFGISQPVMAICPSRERLSGTIRANNGRVEDSMENTLMTASFLYLSATRRLLVPYEVLDLSEIRGGSPWGAGTFASGGESRQPTEKEFGLAKTQGERFYEIVSKVKFE